MRKKEKLLIVFTPFFLALSFLFFWFMRNEELFLFAILTNFITAVSMPAALIIILRKITTKNSILYFFAISLGFSSPYIYHRFYFEPTNAGGEGALAAVAMFWFLGLIGTFILSLIINFAIINPRQHAR